MITEFEIEFTTSKPLTEAAVTELWAHARHFGSTGPQAYRFQGEYLAGREADADVRTTTALMVDLLHHAVGKAMSDEIVSIDVRRIVVAKR